MAPSPNILFITASFQRVSVDWINIFIKIICVGETEFGEGSTVEVPGDELTVTLNNLKPKTTYAVKVQAVSDRGDGVQSDASRARTLPLRPAAPQPISVDVHPNNTVLIGFDAVADPEDASKNIKVRLFVLQQSSFDYNF